MPRWGFLEGVTIAMDEKGHAQMDQQQILGVLQRDAAGLVPVIGVVCSPHVAQLLREELREARKRWRQPLELLIDPALRCFQSEVYYTKPAWEERCDLQRHSRGHQARIMHWLPPPPAS
jgi:hypothetical protein